MNLKYATHKRGPFFEIASKYINAESKVLDIGAGIGNFAKFHDRNDFYLFDGNKETVDLLNETYQNVFLGRLPELPFENNFFDVIHCSHVVEHLEPEVFYSTLKEMDRCLKKGGCLVISAPLMWDGFYDDLSHVRPYPPAIFKNYLCASGQVNRTRSYISTEYNFLEEVYRYKKDIFFKELRALSGGFFLKVFLKFIDLFKAIGLKKYQRTGYTIVLKKNL